VHAIGATVIGEGIETEEVHQALRALGVDLFQGYLFSPPMPVEAALKKSTA
jgi:EAL domain-containing protein (putative c-di-GMP-specific phosphodiesterase class I)